MRVLHVPEQQLCAGINEGNAHHGTHNQRSTFNAKHSTSNGSGIERSELNVELSTFAGNCYAAVLSCFLRISGSFLPSTTARLMVTSAMSSRLGTSYMMSSMMRSSIERNARAPVPFVTACAASAPRASLVTDKRTPSIEKSIVYCFTIAFLVSVRMAT